jgi:hypothetical protein
MLNGILETQFPQKFCNPEESKKPQRGEKLYQQSFFLKQGFVRRE